MSRPAPHFSANVIGSRLERPSRVLIVVSRGDSKEVVTGKTPAAAAGTAALPKLSPKKDFFSARSVNAATSTMPAPVIHTATGKVFHAPRSIVISAANPLNPGMPIDAADAMTKANAANGSARLRPKIDNSYRTRVWVRR